MLTAVCAQGVRTRIRQMWTWESQSPLWTWESQSPPPGCSWFYWCLCYHPPAFIIPRQIFKEYSVVPLIMTYSKYSTFLLPLYEHFLVLLYYFWHEQDQLYIVIKTQARALRNQRYVATYREGEWDSLPTSATINRFSNNSVAQRSISMVQPLAIKLFSTRNGCLVFSWIVVIMTSQIYASYYANNLTLWMIACHFLHLHSNLNQFTTETAWIFGLDEVCSIVIAEARAE